MKALVYTGTNSSELRDVEAPIAAAGQSIVDLSSVSYTHLTLPTKRIV